MDGNEVKVARRGFHDAVEQITPRPMALIIITGRSFGVPEGIARRHEDLPLLANLPPGRPVHLDRTPAPLQGDQIWRCLSDQRI